MHSQQSSNTYKIPTKWWNRQPSIPDANWIEFLDFRTMQNRHDSKLPKIRLIRLHRPIEWQPKQPSTGIHTMMHSPMYFQARHRTSCKNQNRTNIRKHRLKITIFFLHFLHFSASFSLNVITSHLIIIIYVSMAIITPVILVLGALQI